MAEDVAEIKRFLFARMYRHHRVKRMRRKAVGVVQDLFMIFMEDVGMMPDDWRLMATQTASEPARARVIAEYIAGMTDRFALEEHKVLTDPLTRA